jgi:hypothetical protein
MHYKEKFSTYINQELPREERQEIAEHLLQCEDCRAEHDSVKLGASLAGMLRQADAPPGTWDEIEAAMAGGAKPPVPWIDVKAWAFAFASVMVVLGLGAAVYFNLLREKNQPVATSTPPEITAPAAIPGPPAAVPSPAQPEPAATVPVNPDNGRPVPAPGAESLPQTAKIPAVGRNTSPANPSKPPATWNFETIAGLPKVGASSDSGKLAVGDFLETDGASKARIEVADIGNVEIEPNSRVRLVNTSKKQHRLSLERGTLQAQILAPPRLFIVDTPSAMAVDLGCAYKLEVDDAGNSKLYVTSGYVSLERGALESIVPAGAFCFTRHGKGVGTPFFASATRELGAALMRFDFEGGGAASLATVITESRAEDTLTLWHLLPRVNMRERERLFDVMAAFVAPPEGVTREGVLKLDKKMLEAWRIEMENIWFG